MMRTSIILGGILVSSVSSADKLGKLDLRADVSTGIIDQPVDNMADPVSRYGAAGVRLVGDLWWIGIEQEYLSLDDPRRTPPSGFRNMRLGAGAWASLDEALLGADLWLSVPTASSMITDDTAGVAARIVSLRAYGKNYVIPEQRSGVGLSARVGKHDDWLALGFLAASYADIAPVWQQHLNDNWNFGASVGLAQLFGGSPELVAHGEVGVAFTTNGVRFRLDVGNVRSDVSLWTVTASISATARIRSAKSADAAAH